MKSNERTVLLIDDDQTTLEFMDSVIRRVCGDSVVIHKAKDSRESNNILAKMNGKIDLIVSDIKRPGVDGFKHAKMVHEMYPDIPIMLISGFISSSSKTDGLLTAVELKVEGVIKEYFSKPFSISEVSKIFKQYLT